MSVELLDKEFPLVTGASNEALRTSCSPVIDFSKEIKHLAKALIELMRYHKGVGLAAPQVGQLVRMAAVTQRKIKKDKWILKDEFVIINPEIISQSDNLEVESEGCLSLPGQEGKVARPDSVTISYTDVHGKKQLHKADGYNARIILHEMDHLDGVLFLDKLAE